MYVGRAPRQSLTSMLIEAVTERIQSGQYKRGDQLPTEKDMIEEFGVSRTVVREAIANLKASGLVSTRQGKGAFVLEEGLRSFSISEDKLALAENLLEALEVRIAIESEAAALAARRRTPEQLAAVRAACDAMDAALAKGEETVALDLAFHRAIAEATGNRHFVGLFNYLGEVLMTRARLSVSGAQLSAAPYDARTLRDFQSRISADHRMIVEAIAAGDSDGARAALRMHLGGSRDRLAARLRA
ncbi:MAG TPA: FadR/GntR family transcriptional regulator [Amaricoccus sp.]|jgi:DNA-binding FadR family transcriptional regulator|nr:FadR/GntR family transcriptional regulator [Amaricoccus sp.]